MFKLPPLSFDHRRGFPIIEYILAEYDKDFRKEFSWEEFEDKEALQELLLELSEVNKKKMRKKKKLVLSSADMRYLRNLYSGYIDRETNIRFCLCSYVFSMLAIIVSLISIIFSLDLFQTLFEKVACSVVITGIVLFVIHGTTKSLFSNLYQFT